jgi:hypothetical protein
VGFELWEMSAKKFIVILEDGVIKFWVHLNFYLIGVMNPGNVILSILYCRNEIELCAARQQITPGKHKLK